jgi:AraC family transcriptional regulator, regulatory protein of adaptative response / DNA-3-methyladenine glycosylase II
MNLDLQICSRARLSRDARFDGKFFIGVLSSGVYCRSICPARAADERNVRYYPSAAAAADAGFRPCLRCRPEASPGTPAWFGTSAIVSRGLRLISEGALEDERVDRLAERLGVSARHVRRLFIQHLGAAPLEVARTRRIHFAKKLLDETSLPVSQIAYASGFGSLRRFNGEIRRVYDRTPTQLRRISRQHIVAEPECYRLRLAYRPPLDWNALLAFLSARATPGVESVKDGIYRRTIAIAGKSGIISVSRIESRCALCLEVRFPDPRSLLLIVERVRRIFDLGADPASIAETFRLDPLLRGPLAKHPGLRVPGTWDSFELAVRAILGQQISVSAATTIAGRVAATFGTFVQDADALDRLFPDPAQLANAPIEQCGVIPARAEAIRTLARRIVAGTFSLGPFVNVEAAVSALAAVPGIGSWTAQYIAMRALSEPDAFPSGDSILLRTSGAPNARELERRSQPWRPWRAYAAMLLWQASHDARSPAGADKSAPRDLAQAAAGRRSAPIEPSWRPEAEAD